MKVTLEKTVTTAEFEELYESDQMFINEELMDKWVIDYPTSEMQGARGVYTKNKNGTHTYVLVVSYL